MAKKSNNNPQEKTTERSKKKNRLTETELKQFKESLLQKRMQILGDVDVIEGGALKKNRLDATGDLSNMPIHMADVGTDNYEQEFALELMDSERKLLEEIHSALERFEQGSYGICEGTGKPIPKKRLKAQPWARYCIEYAREMEQGRIGEQ